MIGMFEGIEVGAWYRGAGSDPFEVVALDFESETVEIQFYDGSVAELDYDGWLELSASPTTGPDSFDGALDLASEDLHDLTDPGFPIIDGWDEARHIIEQF